MTYSPFLLCASPRRGNSLEAARIFSEGFNAASVGVPGMDVRRLADYRVNPCIDCGACGRGLPCPFLKLEDSAVLFDYLLHSPVIALAAPIYFYHLPAMLKVLVDRCQQYYAWRELGVGELDKLPVRNAYLILLGARERGEQLFSGSLLTLKLALLPFNISLKEPLLLRNLDGPNDLAARPDYREALLKYGKDAATSLDILPPSTLAETPPGGSGS